MVSPLKVLERAQVLRCCEVKFKSVSCNLDAIDCWKSSEMEGVLQF